MQFQMKMFIIVQKKWKKRFSHTTTLFVWIIIYLLYIILIKFLNAYLNKYVMYVQKFIKVRCIMLYKYKNYNVYRLYKYIL